MLFPFFGFMFDTIIFYTIYLRCQEGFSHYFRAICFCEGCWKIYIDRLAKPGGCGVGRGTGVHTTLSRFTLLTD